MTAAYLITAVPISPAFLLGPLGALLLVSHPRTMREWFWIAISIGALAAWTRLPSTLSEQTVRAAAAFFVGGFVALSLAGVRSLFVRAAAAVAIAALAMVGWYLVFHLRFATLENELISQTWDAWRQFLPDLPAVMPTGADLLVEPASVDRARQMAAALTFGVTLFPAWLALTALVGVRLAWSWYHRLATAPILPPAKQFRDFRFNDQLVWLLLAALATALLAGQRPVTLAAANVLMFMGALYAARGAAIVRASLLRAAPMFIGILVLMLLALFTVVPVVLAVVGIADTWVDFRRRMAPPNGVPS